MGSWQTPLIKGLWWFCHLANHFQNSGVEYVDHKDGGIACTSLASPGCVRGTARSPRRTSAAPAEHLGQAQGHRSSKRCSNLGRSLHLILSRMALFFLVLRCGLLRSLIGRCYPHRLTTFWTEDLHKHLGGELFRTYLVYKLNVCV